MLDTERHIKISGLVAGLGVRPRAVEQHFVLGKATWGIHRGFWTAETSPVETDTTPNPVQNTPPTAAGAVGDTQQVWRGQAAMPGTSAQVEPRHVRGLLALSGTGLVTGAPPARGREKISFQQNSSHQALLLQHSVRKDGWIAFSLLSWEQLLFWLC